MIVFSLHLHFSYFCKKEFYEENIAACFGVFYLVFL